MFSVTARGCLFSSDYQIPKEDAGKVRGQYATGMSRADRFFQLIADFFTPSEVWLAREHLGHLLDGIERLNSFPLPAPDVRARLEQKIYSSFNELRQLANADCRNNFVSKNNTLFLFTDRKNNYDFDIARSPNYLEEARECPGLVQETEIEIQVRLQFIDFRTGKVDGKLFKEVASAHGVRAMFNTAINPPEPISAITTFEAISSGLKGTTSLRLPELLLALREVFVKKIGNTVEQKNALQIFDRIRALATDTTTETNPDQQEALRRQLIATVGEARKLLEPFIRSLRPI